MSLTLRLRQVDDASSGEDGDMLTETFILSVGTLAAMASSVVGTMAVFGVKSPGIMAKPLQSDS